MKINIGCGNNVIPGWDNLDFYSDNPDVIKMNVKKLEYKDNEVEEILAQMIIEHFPRAEVIDILKEWCRALKQGEYIKIGTSNLDEMCRDWLSKGTGYLDNLRGIYGQQNAPGMFHYMGFDEQYLMDSMRAAGFKDVKILPTDHPHHLWAEATK